MKHFVLHFPQSSIQLGYFLTSTGEAQNVRLSSLVHFCMEQVSEKLFQLQFHDGFFEDSHQSIEISEFTKMVRTFCEVIHCEQHPEESVKMACDFCCMLLCAECIQSNKSGQSALMTVKGLQIFNQQLKPFSIFEYEVKCSYCWVGQISKFIRK